ncbi:hypothetical protein PHYSODRAFT_299241 [Phytophthora sojae]|uniref:Uncharacterized protein n=1 Tax=Phytophthora sojae (strain P6497) TaxID=1094619 RepID=G4Z408_PHYSP|nr:hypothetical protein PHYSODRAFT_299241 [Phytophthora sojae]EGZ21560.1 hypothetical protein PHYSODRAFT_299241 [Phytophthora sojae]|eukprot:XP_009524277.1 hypothetical protein PHYSODRAFT_299241 [Phytophthora sojae]
MVIMAIWAFEALSIFAGLLPHSVVAVAAHSVLVNVNLVIYATFAGLSVAANIRVGNCLGAGTPDKAKMARTVALTMTLALSVTFATLLYCLSAEIPLLFLDPGESADLASKVMAIWAPFTIMDGLNAVTQGVFRGAGEQRAATTVNALAYYAFAIPFGAFLAFQCNFGVEGLWLGLGCGSSAAVIAMNSLIHWRWSWEKRADDALARTDE